MSNLTNYLLFIYSYHFFIYVNGTISFFFKKKKSVLVDSCQICQLRPKKTHKTFSKCKSKISPHRPEASLFTQRVACRNTCNTRIMGFPIPKNQVTFSRSVVLSLV